MAFLNQPFAAAEPPSARAPVHRHSRMRGRCEGVFYHRMDRPELRRLVIAAKRYELHHRQPSRRNGPLGSVGIEVIELLANTLDRRTGRLDPSIAFLMGRLRRSRDAIVRALRALRDHGFLEWLRRYEATGNEGRGPQVKQASNAYRLSIPAKAMALLGLRWTPNPPPDDDAHARAEAAEAVQAMMECLTLPELGKVSVEDDRLGSLLAAMGSRIKERESVERNEFPLRSIL